LQRAGDGHTLLLTAGKLRRKFIGMLDKTDTIQEFHTSLVCLIARTLEDLHLGKRQIVPNGEMREELEVLKNHAYVRSEFRKVRVRISDIDVVHVDGAFLEIF